MKKLLYALICLLAGTAGAHAQAQAQVVAVCGSPPPPYATVGALLPLTMDVTGKLCNITGTPGQIPGTATNDNAAAGNVGEFIFSTVAGGSAVPLTTATGANMTSVSLTAGDWDCQANVVRSFGATTSITTASSGISTTSATLGSAANATTQYVTAAFVPNAQMSWLTPIVRESLAAPTTIFAVALDNFTVSTDSVFGTLRCRRVR